MKIKIYQVNMERDSDRVCFESIEMLKKQNGTADIDASIYDLVYSGQVKAADLEDIYRTFNIDYPDGYTGRSLSVSDIVQVVENENSGTEPGFYYCDSVGFVKTSFDAEKADNSLKKKTLKVVLVEPGKTAKAVEIDAGLKSLQNTVGGNIEAFYPFPENTCIVCNEEGKYNGMLPNRAICDENGNIIDVIFGTFFICATGGEDFGSLSPEQVERYVGMYRQPERIISLNGAILAVPYDAPGEKMKNGAQ